MNEYIITISTQFETFNIVGISEKVLFHVIKAYYNEVDTLKLGGKTYSLKRIQDFVIHKFENDNGLDEFLNFIKENKLKKVAMTGNSYIESELIDDYAKNVTLDYLTIDREQTIEDSEINNKLSEENKEILKGIDELLERLSKIELGQEIIYEDLRKDIEEVKEFVGKASKKTLRQLVLGKLVDAGLGAIAGEALNAIKESGVLKIG